MMYKAYSAKQDIEVTWYLSQLLILTHGTRFELHFASVSTAQEMFGG